jgi:Phage integrase family
MRRGFSGHAPDFRWHDLRHTWASWLAQEGVPMHDIREMGGWETAAMARRYAHLSPAHLAHRAKVLDGLIDTIPAQLLEGNRKVLEVVVAKAGIEPATHGFSVVI